MKIGVNTNFGPINSKPVFKAFIESLQNAGEEVLINNNNNCDVAVIWSVLWQGRMIGYHKIWNEYQAKKKPIIVLEVGGIKRNQTWKIGINGVNREADFANQLIHPLDDGRWKKFNIKLNPWKQTGDNIVLCGQHHNSHQWRNNPSMSKWFETQINEIRKYTDKPIIVRRHPRNNIHLDVKKFSNVKIINPVRDIKTYDDTNFIQCLQSAWAVVNYSSNPAMQAVFAGIPVFVSEASLSYDVGNSTLANINNPNMPDRQSWANRLAYTEWWTDEIAQGIPWERIKKRVQEKYLL
jgi:DNA polymerase IIIc chi subunit